MTQNDTIQPPSSGVAPASSPSPVQQPDHANHAPGQPRRVTRAQRRRLDTEFQLERDALPESPAPLPPPTTSNGSSTSAHQPANNAQTAGQPHVRNPFRTDPDIFGRYRVYYSRPPTIPDADAPMAHMLPSSNTPHTMRSLRPISDIIAPCPNISVFYVLRYHWLSGNSKSLNDREYLCNEVLLQPDFNPRDLTGINLNKIDSELAAAAKTWDPACPPAEGWKNIPLRLRIPPPRPTQTRAATARPATQPGDPIWSDDCIKISGYRARGLTDLMKKTFAKNDTESFHYEPFEHRWNPPGSSGRAQTLSGEMYTSPAMIKAHREVQSLDIDCDLPRCVAGFMFASDGMQFASFSHVKGWPILCSFSNMSKYERCKPTSNAYHPVAHIPTLPDKVKEQIKAMHGKAPTKALLTHLRRELMHAVWVALLDDEFVEAWRTGVVILCADADYPENTASNHTQWRGLSLPTLFFELGVWKALFQHLIRLLHQSGPQALAEFNRRFRSLPTFAATIQMFAEDVSDMGRIAARDFEDILQCCGPVFKGLLPKECEEPAQTLIFLFAEWHGLAKLRLHTTATLDIFKTITSRLGTALRGFATLTKNMKIRETPKEYARRKKRSESNKAVSMTRRVRSTDTSTNTSKAQSQQNSDSDGRRICILNLNTYKMHSLGDYPSSIEEYGTTDSYSTQIGELQNRKFKAQYMRTNKRNAVEQMTEIDDIMVALQDINKELNEAFKAHPPVNSEAIESLVRGRPYFIGQAERSEDMIPNISMWVANQAPDSAVKFFYPQLKRHLLGRVLGNPNRTDFSVAELAQLDFHKGRMYRHKTLRVNYTSYDVLRQQDVLNAATPHCFIMLPTESNEQEPGAHPFIYAKVLGVYHANIVYRSRLTQRMDFVHVRWLYYDYERPGGWDHKRLDRLTYQACNTSDDILDSFDFVDPANILRASHLIPDFCSDTTKNLLNQITSIAYDDAEFGDWNAYYVNRFVDRDMLMRYIGGGVGHYRQTNKNATAHADEPHEPEIEAHEDDDANEYEDGREGDGPNDEGLAGESENEDEEDANEGDEDGDEDRDGDGDGDDDEELEGIDNDEDADRGEDDVEDDLYGF
ncbi:hypothetical protein FRC06_002302 [Ceratobasidium sp. 370]|nr:hypothetical protein FRC06_002302 [Ceratobasidium sp. 370]